MAEQITVQHKTFLIAFVVKWVNQFIINFFIIYKLYNTAMAMIFTTLNNNGANNYSINSTRGRYQGNALLQGKGAMPAKFYPSDGSNMFSLSRQVWTKDAGGGVNTYQSSDYIRMKKMNAIGKSSFVTNSTDKIAFSGVNKNTVTHQRRFVRSGGTVAPAKKGAIK
jgi:hypothetical protein